MPGGLLPDDDLYARLEVGVDASPEAIEVAWRALLKRHHPDVAGSDDAALDRAKRINVAHDWLSDPSLRARYDADRLGLAPLVREGARARGYRPRVAHHPWGRQTGSRSTSTRPGTRPDLMRGTPEERVTRFLARVERLTAGRARPPRRRRAPADRVPRHDPAVPHARGDGVVRRGRDGARRPRAGRSAGRRSGYGRDCWVSPPSSSSPRSSTTCSPSRSGAARANASCAPGTPAWTSRATAPTRTVSRPCASASRG